jgi:hypothetical protein
MSLRDKNKKVLSEGARERATFQPEPDSAPLKVYQYWLRVTDREPFRENFCHFWRVVLIWAPLAFLVHEGLKPVFTSRPMRKFGRGVAWVFQKPNEKWKEVPFETRDKIEWGILYGVMTIFCLAALVGVVALVMSEGWLPLVFIIGSLAAVVGFVTLLVWLGEIVTQRKRAKRAERDRLRRENYSEYLAKDDEFLPKKESRLKTRVKAFFRGLGDFLILIVNVVRVKKWKICPLVEIPEQGVDTSRPVV